jgi:hypothetical protein
VGFCIAEGGVPDVGVTPAVIGQSASPNYDFDGVSRVVLAPMPCS